MQNGLKISFRDIMSPAFRRHGKGEAFRTLTRQPENPQTAVSRWQMPWMYLRLFGILLFMAAVCIACIWQEISKFPAPYIYAFFWCGSIVPLTLAMFLWELDPFANVSIFEMMGLALVSGVVCVLFGTPVDYSIISGYFDPVWSYVKDSILMLGMTILVLVCTKKRMYGLDGLALGASIGAGYALFTMLMVSIPTVARLMDFSGLSNAITTAVPMFFGNHALWFAPVAGALGLRMRGEKINIRHFLDIRLILLILLGFAENYLMNSAQSPFGWTFLNADLIALTRTDAIQVKHVIVLAIGMAALIRTIRPCVAQALTVGSGAVVGRKARTGRLIGISGTYANRVVTLLDGRELRVGRETGKHMLTLHGEGVSRVHCLLTLREGSIIVRDLGSSNGTWLNGKRLTSEQDTPISKGDVLAIGSPKERFEVQ